MGWYMIQVKNMMLTIVKNPLGFHIVDVFQKEKYLTLHAISNMFYN
jgi:hypothetical protein